MKKLKKFKRSLALLLIIAMSACFNATVFAAEDTSYPCIDTQQDELEPLFRIISVQSVGTSVGTGVNYGYSNVTVEVQITRNCPNGVYVRAGATGSNSRFSASVYDQVHAYGISLCSYSDNIYTNGGRTSYKRMYQSYNAGDILIFNFNIENSSAYAGCIGFVYDVY